MLPSVITGIACIISISNRMSGLWLLLRSLWLCILRCVLPGPRHVKRTGHSPMPLTEILPPNVWQLVARQLVQCEHAALQEFLAEQLLQSDASITLQLQHVAGGTPPLQQQAAGLQAFLDVVGAVRACRSITPLKALTLEFGASSTAEDMALSLPHQQLAQLRHLSIASSDNNGITQLQLHPTATSCTEAFSMLTRLNVNAHLTGGIQLAADPGWGVLAGLTSLRNLNLSGVAVATAAAASAEEADAAASSAQPSWCVHSAALAEALGSLVQLTCLQLDGCTYQGMPLGGAVMSQASRLTLLRTLSLAYIGTDEQPLALVQLPSNLGNLHVESCCISNEATAGRTSEQWQLPALHNLWLTTHIEQQPGREPGPEAATAAVAQLVAAAPNLCSLRYRAAALMHLAEGASFEDAAEQQLLDAVAQLRKLRFLTLGGLRAPAPATGTGFPKLGPAPAWHSGRLESVTLSKCRLPADVLPHMLDARYRMLDSLEVCNI